MYPALDAQVLLQRLRALEERWGGLVLPEVPPQVSGTGSLEAFGVAGTAVELLPAGTITVAITLLFVVSAITGADSSGGTVALGLSDSFALYNDATDVLTLSVTAGGALQVQRTAGADTFNCRFTGVWL